MNKSNKYKIYYYHALIDHPVFNWRIAIKKLNLILAFHHYNNERHFVSDNFNISKRCNILNNFLIEPNLINMLKSKDSLTINLAFEILNNRLNERTKCLN